MYTFILDLLCTELSELEILNTHRFICPYTFTFILSIDYVVFYHLVDLRGGGSNEMGTVLSLSLFIICMELRFKEFFLRVTLRGYVYVCVTKTRGLLTTTSAFPKVYFAW